MKKALILLALTGCMFCINTTLKAQQKADTTHKAKQMQQLAASIAGIGEGVISKDVLLKADSLVCTDKKTTIVSFTLTISANGNLTEVQSKSNLLTSDMKRKIGEMVAGNKLYFENIKAKLPDGSIRTLSSINLKIQ